MDDHTVQIKNFQSHQYRLKSFLEVFFVLDLSMTLFLLVPWLPPGFLLILVGFGEAQEQTPMTEWTTTYSLEAEHQIAQNSLLTTLPDMTKEWRVTFDINPTDYNFNDFASVLHLTIGGKGVGSRAKVGDRNPAIWFHKTKGVLVSTALDGKASYSKYFYNLPLAGEWTRIEVSQSLVSSQYIYSINIGTEQVFTTPNTKPEAQTDVKVFAGSPWYQGQKGSLRNLKIEIKTPIDCVEAGEMHIFEDMRLGRPMLVGTFSNLSQKVRP